MGMWLTVIGLILSAAGALIIATFDPDPSSIVAELDPDHPQFARTEPASWAGRKWNSWVRGPPTFEDDDPSYTLTAASERLVRLWGGWGAFVLGVVVQIAGELT